MSQKCYGVAKNETTKTIIICDENYEKKFFISKNQNINRYLSNKSDIEKIIKKLKKFNLSDEEVAIYLYPEIKNIFEQFNYKIYQKETADEIEVYKNLCKIKIISGQNGICYDKEKFYKDFLNLVINNNKKIMLKKIIFKNVKINKNNCQKKSEFKTYFGSSSAERKNNIKLALECFDGIILNEGEKLSFNITTGVRNKEKGYAQAKIIQNGTFASGYGGGVCQVSTTLYNACLLAGLEILEVHSHSLPVSYVEPSFDAMVNMGSSDLVVKNNTGSKIIFTTSSKDDYCRVVIFGTENQYKLKTVSKTTEIIPASTEKIIESDYKKYGYDTILDNEEIVLSHAKDGLKSQGYLYFYDKNEKLIKTQKIRDTVYYPTKTVVLKKENLKN